MAKELDKDFYNDLKNKTEEMGEEALDKVKKMASKITNNNIATTICDYVESNPWRTAGIAFGIGFLFAKYTNKKCD